MDISPNKGESRSQASINQPDQSLTDQKQNRNASMTTPDQAITENKDEGSGQGTHQDKDSQNKTPEEKISILEKQLKACINSRHKIEAEELKIKIKELRIQVVIKKNKELNSKHAEEVKQLAQVQAEELRVFAETWKKRIDEYKKEAQIAEEEMLDKHKKDLSALEKDLKASLPFFARTSAKIMNLKKTIEILVKQKEFAQADELIAQCELLEQEEYKKTEEEREKKVLFILVQLANKQKNELNAFKKRISAGYFDLLKARELEYQKLSNKLHTVQKGLETAQHLEFTKFETTYKNYVPGEKIQFNTKKKGPCDISFRNNTYASTNISFMEAKKSATPNRNCRQRSFTPVRQKPYLQEFYSNNTGKAPQSLLPINQTRFVPNQNQDKKVVSQLDMSLGH